MDATKTFLSQVEFCKLTKEQREKLREVFNISKSGQVKVSSVPGGNDVLVSDGTEPEDLMHSLNLKNILHFLGRAYVEGAENDFDELFGKVFSKLFPEEKKKEVAPKTEPVVEIPIKESEQTVEDKKIVVTQKKRGRPKKDA